MDERKTIFDYIKQIFATFGIITTIFIVMVFCFGKIASEYSSLYQLGEKGLAISTLLQLLVFSLLICVIQNVFLTDICIKNMPLITRNICFFASMILLIVLFVIFCGWFEVDNIMAWIGFGASFLICTLISLWIMKLEEKSENEKMAKALEKFKEM